MGSGSFLKVVAKNFDVLAGPVITLLYPLLPFWSYMNLIFNCWLVLPYFNGAAYVYQNFVRPMFVKQVQETVNVWYVPQKKSIFSKPDDFLFAVEKFIEENGPEALQKLAENAPKPKKSGNKRVTFAEVEHKKETTKSSKNDKHVIHHKKDTQQESSSWSSSSSNFMIFSDENHYWT